MQLDSVAVALRPRNLWEAIDLGFGMVRTWWKPVFGAWLAVVLPVGVVINLLCWDALWLAPLLMWWLKPLFDRIPLYILSRAAFGETPGIRETLKAVLPLWRKSLLWDLTLGRFDLARSFNMPVRDLEGLRGKARRQRLKILQKQTRNGAVWLTLVCVHLEAMLNIALFAMLYLLLPQTIQSDFFRQMFATSQDAWLEVLQHVFYLVAMTAMEPFYVAAGFALYLNRRTMLEAWDIEIAFRRMAQRHLASAKPALSAAVLIAMLVLGGTLGFPGNSLAAVTAAAPQSALPPVVAAAETPERLKQRISQVLKQPEFQTDKIEQHWKYVGKQARKKPADSDPAWLKFLARIVPGMARVFEGLLWLLVAAAIVWLVVKRKRWLGRFERGPAVTPVQPAQVLFGLDIQPQSLPENIAEEAWRLGQGGQQRAALSLLYRGALARWVMREKITLGVNATEGDCMRLFRAGAPQETGDYFCQLTQVWQNMAYAGRQPRTEDMQLLCRGWDMHFGQTA